MTIASRPVGNSGQPAEDVSVAELLKEVGSRRLQCLLLALLSAAVILAWQELLVQYQYGGNQTGLFCTGARFETPPPLRGGTYLFPDSYGYDGQFYRYIAHDPFFTKGFSKYIDDPRHRYGRILVPLTAWVISAGWEPLIDRAFQLTVAAFCGLGVYWCCAYLLIAGLPAWLGAAAFLLLPATLTSADRLLVDGPLCALFAGFLYYSKLARWRAVYLIAVLAPLVRETGLLVAVGVVAGAALAREWKRAAVFATAAIPALLWALCVTAHTAPTGAAHIFERPVIGLFLRLLVFRGDYAGVNPSLFPLLQTVSFLSMAGFIACLAIVAARLCTAHRNEGWGAVQVSLACFLFLGLAAGHPAHVSEAYGYARPLSPLILWVVLTAIIGRRFALLIPPLLVSGGVGMYLAYGTLMAVGNLL